MREIKFKPRGERDGEDREREKVGGERQNIGNRKFYTGIESFIVEIGKIQK